VNRYAVFGHPVKHSKSPWIHTRFAEQTGAQLVYTAEDIQPDEFESRVREFFAHAGSGLNITVPFKERAFAMAEQLTAAARTAGAANTLYLDSAGSLCADNTDGIGMLRDIVENYGGVLAGKDILVLGAGGAVRGVIGPLLAARPASLMIANRTLDKAQRLLEKFPGAAEVAVSTYDRLPDRAFDFIINGTSAGLEGTVPPLPATAVGASTWCYDMFYGEGDTAFQRWAKEHGAALALDGLGMLVEQAAQSYQVWRGVKPQTIKVIQDLRALLRQPA